MKIISKKTQDLISLCLNILYLYSTRNKLRDCELRSSDNFIVLFLFNIKQAYLKVYTAYFVVK